MNMKQVIRDFVESKIESLKKKDPNLLATTGTACLGIGIIEVALNVEPKAAAGMAVALGLGFYFAAAREATNKKCGAVRSDADIALYGQVIEHTR